MTSRNRPYVRRMRPTDVDYGTSQGDAYPWLCFYSEGCRRISLSFKTQSIAFQFGVDIVRMMNRR